MLIENKMDGIEKGFYAYPHTATVFKDVASRLLNQNKHSSLTRLQREMIATITSFWNECVYCTNTHLAMCVLLSGEENIFDAIQKGNSVEFDNPEISHVLELEGLIHSIVKGNIKGIDEQISMSYQYFSNNDIHEAICIASAFLMFNSYVKSIHPESQEKEMGNYRCHLETMRKIKEFGY